MFLFRFCLCGVPAKGTSPKFKCPFLQSGTRVHPYRTPPRCASLSSHDPGLSKSLMSGTSKRGAVCWLIFGWKARVKSSTQQPEPSVKSPSSWVSSSPPRLEPASGVGSMCDVVLPDPGQTQQLFRSNVPWSKLRSPSMCNSRGTLRW